MGIKIKEAILYDDDKQETIEYKFSPPISLCELFDIVIKLANKEVCQ